MVVLIMAILATLGFDTIATFEANQRADSGDARGSAGGVLRMGAEHCDDNGEDGAGGDGEREHLHECRDGGQSHVHGHMESERRLQL